MSFLDDMIAKGKGTLGELNYGTPTGDHTDAIKRDTFDEMDWRSLRQDVPNIDKAIEEVAMRHDYVKPFYEDFYNILHQGDPLLRDKNECLEEYGPNQEMAEHFLDLPEVKSLRVSTTHDQYGTAFALLSMQEKILEQYAKSEEAREEIEKAKAERQKLQEMAQQLLDMLGEAEAMPEPDEDDEEAQAEAQAAAEAIQEILDAIEDQSGVTTQALARAQQAGQDAANRGEPDIQLAAKEANESLQEENDLFKAFGLEDGDLKKMDFHERARLAATLKNNRLAQFAKLMGQFRNIESGEVRRRIVHTPDTIVDVELGDDLHRLTGSELANLAAPETEDDFWRRLADKELIVYKLEGKEKMGKGPIIVICDESGSMGGWGFSTNTSTPEAWSKAISLALNDRCRRDGRDFHYIGFSSPSQVWHSEFPGGKAPIEKVIEFTEHFFGGGTYYEPPLRMAMKIVQDYHERGKPKPDIVFITDDEFRGLDPQFFKDWEQLKHDTSLRCFGILIGHNYGERSELGKIADNIRSLTDIQQVDPNQVRDIFRTI
jgi:uncharacterized protein with von Willebrand factor type A (vWA) domain